MWNLAYLASWLSKTIKMMDFSGSAARRGVVQCIVDIKHFECIYGFDGLQPRVTCYFG